MKTDTNRSERWSGRKVALALFPFVWAAVAVNLFLLGLIGLSLGLPSLSPFWSMALALALALPATSAAARWVNRLLERAEE